MYIAYGMKTDAEYYMKWRGHEEIWINNFSRVWRTSVSGHQMQTYKSLNYTFLKNETTFCISPNLCFLIENRSRLKQNIQSFPNSTADLNLWPTLSLRSITTLRFGFFRLSAFLTILENFTKNGGSHALIESKCKKFRFKQKRN